MWNVCINKKLLIFYTISDRNSKELIVWSNSNMDLEKVVLKAKFYRYPVAGTDRARRQAGPRLGPIALTTNQGYSGAQCQPYLSVRSREYRFTHKNRSTVDIPFLSEALSGERIWVILKVAKSNEEGLVIATGGEGEEGEKVNLKA